MIRFVKRLGLAGVALALVGAAPVGTVAVEITGVRSAKGVVHVDLCPQAQFLKDSCRLSGDAPVAYCAVNAALMSSLTSSATIGVA